jgi:2-hydroxychromene-2-carboxylate isomerase
MTAIMRPEPDRIHDPSAETTTMAMPKVEFHFDFGSPNAYLSHLVIPQIEKRTGATFEYVPVLLGGVFKATNNRSPGETNAGIKNKGEYGKLEMQRFIDKHGLTFAFNPNFPVNTLMMMRGAVAAQQLGIFPAYVDAMYRFMWAEPRKMDDPAIVMAAWKESGFDAEKLGALIQDQAVKDKLLANTQKSVERGTFGSPTFFVGDEIFFGKDRLREVEEMIVERKAA